MTDGADDYCVALNVVGLHIALVIHKGFDKVTWPTKLKEETESDQEASDTDSKNSACVSECSCGDEAKYGFRVVTIVGSLVSSAAFALSYFATSVEYLYLVSASA
ncbi:hypothetical protein MSG28_009610 [Choristoneura fumiferana]|uniref:Uncharacterized protein n=1 Tax=Choristoneura fumiferana TaxID=7141 RepID=A0ACC0JBS6_CHOFU|nr:hypothetical protein MSG28_009610 [Choristoneura fumiferana]